jgi:hypothetical protein
MEDNYFNRVGTQIKKDIDIEEAIVSSAIKLASRLNKEIERGHAGIAFFIAILLAAFKDFQDIIWGLIGDALLAAFGIGVIPLAITWAVGLFVSVTLTYFLWRKGWFIKTKIWIIWVIVGIFFENIPVFEMLPLEVLTVLYAWRNVRKRAKKAKHKLKNIDKLTAQEITALNEDIGLLENAPSNYGGKLKKSTTHPDNKYSSYANNTSRVQLMSKDKFNENQKRRKMDSDKALELARKEREERYESYEEARQRRRETEESYGGHEKYNKDLTDLRYRYGTVDKKEKDLADIRYKYRNPSSSSDNG